MSTPRCYFVLLLKCVDSVSVTSHHPELGNRLSLFKRSIDYCNRLTILLQQENALVDVTSRKVREKKEIEKEIT